MIESFDSEIFNENDEKIQQNYEAKIGHHLASSPFENLQYPIEIKERTNAMERQFYDRFITFVFYIKDYII